MDNFDEKNARLNESSSQINFSLVPDMSFSFQKSFSNRSRKHTPETDTESEQSSLPKAEKAKHSQNK